MSERKRRTFRNVVAGDLDTLPFMGLFVVLIPMLLLSAVFLEITVVDLDLPDEDAAPPDTERFTVSVRILDEALVMEAKGWNPLTIPGKTEASLTALSEALGTVAARNPGHHAVTIISEPDTRYEEIISVMDVSREAGLGQVSLMGAAS
jgi:biopolymer transport protein ExbD